MVRVKHLNWKLSASGGLLAHSIIGMFTIEKVEGGYVYTHYQASGETKGYRARIEEAKLRCYKMVEEAILGAIE